MAKIKTIKIWEIKNDKAELKTIFNQSETLQLLKNYKEEFWESFSYEDTTKFIMFSLQDFSNKWSYDKNKNLHIWLFEEGK